MHLQCNKYVQVFLFVPWVLSRLKKDVLLPHPEVHFGINNRSKGKQLVLDLVFYSMKYEKRSFIGLKEALDYILS